FYWSRPSPSGGWGARASHTRIEHTATGEPSWRAGGPVTPAGRAASLRALIEHQDGARDLAGLHRAERFVDVLEPAAARDHLVELEPSLPVELDVAGHVDLEP